MNEENQPVTISYYQSSNPKATKIQQVRFAYHADFLQPRDYQSVVSRRSEFEKNEARLCKRGAGAIRYCKDKSIACVR